MCRLRRGVANEILKSQRCSHGNNEFSSRELGDTLYEANSQRRGPVGEYISFVFERKQRLKRGFIGMTPFPLFIEWNYIVESIGE